MSTVMWILIGLGAGVLGVQILVSLQSRKTRSMVLRRIGGPFGEAITSGTRVVAYFYSTTCKESRAQTPIIDRLMEEFDDIYKIDVAEEFATARALGILTTPTTVIIEGGGIRDLMEGKRSEAALREALM